MKTPCEFQFSSDICWGTLLSDETLFIAKQPSIANKPSIEKQYSFSMAYPVRTKPFTNFEMGKVPRNNFCMQQARVLKALELCKLLNFFPKLREWYMGESGR